MDGDGDLSAAAEVHTGAMIALLPSEEDAARLALHGGEPQDQLHLTLYYLGEAADWPEPEQASLIAAIGRVASGLSTIHAHAFGAALWNPDGEGPCWVWNVGGSRDPETTGSTLGDAYRRVTVALEDRHGEARIPEQHAPWSPHVAAVYSSDNWSGDLAERVGPVTFDRIRVAFAGKNYDFPMSALESVADLASSMPPQLREYWLVGPGAAKVRWGTPGLFKRCVKELRSKFPQDPEGLCANLYHEATGQWPGRQHSLSEDEGGKTTEELESTIMADGMGDTAPLGWHTPDGSGLAFEGLETGDGRIFAPGALYWEEGPWPLQYSERMGEGHNGAELAGSIMSMARSGDGAITATGCIYPSVDAGEEAAMLLSQGAPIGVSVDLDDVSVEFIDRSSGEPVPPEENMWPEDAPAYSATAASMSVLRTGDGWHITSRSEMEWTASGTSMAGQSTVMRLLLDEEGAVPRSLFAAAGDGDPGDGLALDSQSSGDVLMRITRARVRGATLVSMPAFAGARIELDEMPAAPPAPNADLMASGEAAMFAVVDLVTSANRPMRIADVAYGLGLPIEDARSHLSRATQEGMLVKLARAAYVRPLPKEAMIAAATGDTGLPIADRNTPWDSTKAQTAVKMWADGDPAKLKRAYLWVDPSKDPANVTSYKLQVATLIGDRLTIVPDAVFAVAAVLQGARGGVDIPEADVAGVKSKVEALYSAMEKKFDQPYQVPWATASGEPEELSEADTELFASAWRALADMPPMPAEWFQEPTAEELPPGGPGMNYKDGRVFGWVAQAGEPHAGYAKKITIDTLGRIDTTHFLRQRFQLDNGSQVKAGAFTMNTGHHRDGAECETGACAFDDTRTVAAIVTVGMNERGMWFSGAAHPALSEWDRRVFSAVQPSYHLKQGPGGNWQLRGVLAVPVPGHSSPLLASAVIERTNLALMASAAMDLEEPQVQTEGVQAAELLASLDYDRLADAMVAAMSRAEQRKADEEAELAALIASASELDA